MTLTELFTSIADKIREWHEWAPEKIKATDFPREIEIACNEREILGHDLGMYEGIEAGKQEEHDIFWDRYQENGNRTHYYMAFNSTGTTAWWYDNFKPKYDFKINHAQYMFYGFGALINEPFDLKQHLDNLGIGFDTTECQSFMQAFINSTISHIPYLDCTAALGDRLVDAFRNCQYLETIDGMKTKAETPFSNTFLYCYKLKNISFDGVIGQNISFHTSPLLTAASLRSILSTLSKNTTQANGKTLTLNTASKAVIEADTTCSEQLALAVSAGWTVAYNS